MRAARVRVVGYLSVDVVQRDGIVSEQVPGGAAVYAALGARHAGASVAVDAMVGADYPQPWLRELDALGIDVSRVKCGDGATRTTILQYDGDGRRTSPHHRQDHWWERTRALAPGVADGLDQVDVLIACPMPANSLARLLYQATVAGVPVVADTSEAFVLDDPQSLLACVGQLAIFAPSREETRLLLPLLEDDAAADWLARKGPHILHKRGSQGATAVSAHGGTRRVVPAPPVTVIDPTGAGDATVGALAARWAGGIEFLDAAAAALATGALATSGLGPVALGLDIRSLALLR